MSFKTEKEVESLLIAIERKIDGPGEQAYPISMMRIQWDAFDYVVGRFTTLGFLLRESERLALAHNISLSEATAYQVTSLYRWGKDELALDLPFDPPVCPLSHKPTARSDDMRK